MPKKGSICKGKRVKPNKCKKLRGCKVARGPKRTFCRRKRNRSRARRNSRTASARKNKTKRLQRMLKTNMRDSRLPPYPPSRYHLVTNLESALANVGVRQ